MRIQVIGGGSWGLALARLLGLQGGHEVSLWCRNEDRPDVLRETRHSPFFLTDMLMPKSVEVADVIAPDADVAVLAVPSHAMRAVVSETAFSEHTLLVNVAKGIENDSLLRMSQVIGQVRPRNRVVTLSGPSHAEEVSKDLPAAVVAAGNDAEACALAQRLFTAPTFRVYTSPDIIGVELGGALKNVIAIAAGACDGLGLGDNAKAALITRGLAEMARLGAALGANPLTFAGLSGMGDLIVTCASRHSRNRAVGEKIAQGATLDAIAAASPMVAEGIKTTRAAHALANRHQIEMPVTAAVHHVLFENGDARESVVRLMTREPKRETI